MIKIIARIIRPARSALAPCLAIVLAGIFVTGCSFGGRSKPYPNLLEKNLRIKTEFDSGDTSSRMKISVSVFSVDAKCQKEYQGTVKLKDALTEVGIPKGRVSYLRFFYEATGFLNPGGTMSMGKFLKPRKGLHYDITTSYLDDMYYVEIFEVGKGKNPRREVELRELNTCKEG